MTGPYAGLYVHVPFCARVCPYCDFAVRTGDAARQRRYVDHLLLEISFWSDWTEPFDTIYFGGGTPSRLDPDELARALEAIAARLPLAADTRVFLEANPEDVTAERAAAWKGLGVATLSLGVQAFDDAALTFLGRRHGSAGSRAAIGHARAAGFQTVSIDLIYGLPQQTDDAWRRQLRQAVESGVDHISCYQLTIHDGTRFGLLARRGTLGELPEDRQAGLFRLTHRFLNEHGLEGYEVSQFAAGPEHRSRHNMKYWNHSPYLGLGPSAHSHRGDRRWWNLRRADAWQERLAEGGRAVEAEETLGPRELALESLITGLRTYAGLDLGAVRQRLGLDLYGVNRDQLDCWAGGGLLALAGERIVPTLEGLAVADSLARQFVIP